MGGRQQTNIKKKSKFIKSSISFRHFNQSVVFPLSKDETTKYTNHPEAKYMIKGCNKKTVLAPLL